LPDLVFNKPKQGFSIPLKHWLRGPLRPLMTDLLSAGSLSRQGLFHPPTVEAWITEHLAGKANHSHRLWALMVFQLWHQNAPDRAHTGR
jgi:asparagine synthase (glutamine-hydrolysing)